MKMKKESRGVWDVWVGDLCVIGYNQGTREIFVSNFSGRFESNTSGSSGEIAQGLGQKLNEFVNKQVTDETVASIMTTIVDHLLVSVRRGSIREVAPHWEHDCAGCTFLGRSKKSLMDLYFCEQPEGPFPTIIARWGNEPQENKSGLLIALTGHDEELYEGLHLAVSSGMFLGREHILHRMGTKETVDCLLQAC